ncbi:hypothetical protein ACFVHB_08965 [Kitasatospora sp. NPDC127111]|uniref:hypothetical protein n=1 Tax=Kitasatospora sp. NPDC127111 TaxID=3345363 RepID=UPI00363D485F
MPVGDWAADRAPSVRAVDVLVPVAYDELRDATARTFILTLPERRARALLAMPPLDPARLDTRLAPES